MKEESNATEQQCNKQSVITRFLKVIKEKRERRNKFNFILKVTTCSHCEKPLSKCKCPYREMNIDMLYRSLNGL